MGSRFHALPTDRLIESNNSQVGSHTDVAMYRDTNYREPEQSMVTEPPLHTDLILNPNANVPSLKRLNHFLQEKIVAKQEQKPKKQIP